MPKISNLRAVALSAVLLVSSCTTPAPKNPEPLTAEAAAEAMFTDALQRPSSPSAPFDADLLKSLFAKDAAITWSSAGPDAASGAYRLADVRVEILGDTPFTMLTADEVLLWNADIAAIKDRFAGTRLDETLRIFDRIEMSGVHFDLDDYMNTVQEIAQAAVPEAQAAPVVYDDSSMNVGRIVFEGLTLHPWTLKPNEGGDEAIEGIRLVSALARSVSLDSSMVMDAVLSQKLTEGGLEGSIDQVYDRQILKGYDRGNIAAMVTTGTSFTASIPVPNDMATNADEGLPAAYSPVEMAGSYGLSSWSGFEFANLLAWGEKGQMPPITERDLISFGESSIKDMKFGIGGQPFFEAAEMDFSMDKFSWILPERIVFTQKDASFDLGGFLTFAASLEPDAVSKEGEPSLTEIIGMLERTGLSKLSGDGSFALTWDSETGAAALENSGVTDNVFSGITRFDFALPSYAELVPAFGADGISPSEDALGQLFESQFAFSGARYSITDIGGLNAIAALVIEIAKLQGDDVPMLGNFAESTPEDVRAFASGMVMFGSGAVASEVPQATAWAGSLSKFITDGGTIDIVAAPAKPVTVADITGAGPDAGMVESPGPAELVDLLGLTVVHTPPAAE